MNYQIKIYENNTWSDLDGAVRPFTYGTTLDETLDEGKINVSMTTRSTKIKPFTPMRIYVDGTRIDCVVGSTKRTRRTYDGTTYYDWEIQALEPTKKLERSVIDNMTVTRHLYDDYTSKFTIISPMIKVIASDNMNVRDVETTQLTPNLLGPLLKKDNETVVVPVYKVTYNIGLMISKQQGVGYFELKRPDGTTYVFTHADNIGDQDANMGSESEFRCGNAIGVAHTPVFPTLTFVADKLGIYEIIGYYGDTGLSGTIGGILASPTAARYVKLTSQIAVFESLPQRAQPTITSVCERLLSAGVTRRLVIDKQKYTLDETFVNKYSSELAPEFSFTSCTLFEALLQVGGKIHAIPRLIDVAGDDEAPIYKVTFDELGGNYEVLESNLPPLNYEDTTMSLEDYCGTIDSPAQNLLNTQDKVRGAISEPFVTVRCDEGEVEISADTACIRTSMPIYQMIKLECKVNGEVYDISPYVYEDAVYQTLTSYVGGVYPYSKEYALVYSQGGKKIGGLNAVANATSKIQTVWLKYAIVNILKTQGVTIGETDIINLAFKVTYVPIVSSRVTQSKVYAGEYDDDNVLFYNQSANMAETGFYGDKMRGAIMRLGQEVVQRTYTFNHYADIPQCGQVLVDDDEDETRRYISRVDYEFDKEYIRATLMLTKDFNMLAQYVGLDSNVRMYDVSEKQVVDRCVHYAENCYLSKTAIENEDKGAPIIEKNYWLPSTRYGEDDSVKIKAAYIQPAVGVDIVRPVAAFPFGTSVAFAFSMLDNYGADYQAVNVAGETNKRSQRLVPYADGLGEIENLIVHYYNGEDDKNWDAEYENRYPSVSEGHTGLDARIGTTNIAPFVIKKDSKEAISLVYQVHFKALENDIVIGSALSKLCPLVNDQKDDNIQVVFFKHELSRLSGVVDITADCLAVDFVSNGTYVQSISPSNYTNRRAVFSSWALCLINEDESKGEVIVGRNETTIVRPINGEAFGTATTPIYFNLCDNKHKQTAGE